MALKLAQCPCSWGVESPDAPHNPPWTAYLDECVDAGYHGVELGPLGYLPTDPERLAEALRTRGLQLSAGYLMEPLAVASMLPRTVERARVTAQTLSALGAERMVLIDDLNPSRSSTAGRPEAAERLDDDGFATLVAATKLVAEIVGEGFGLTVVFHPHVGTYLEFRDEIDRLLEAVDDELVGLCLDTGHSVYAGIDPIDLFESYSDRVRYMHLKDVNPLVKQRAQRDGLTFEAAVDRGMFVPVGSGEVAYATLFDRMRLAGYEGWVAVEQDRPPLTPGSGQALADARESLQYVRAAGMLGAGTHPNLSTERHRR